MDELRCLLDTPYLRVSYDVDHEWLYSELLGVHSEESVIRCTESIFACLAKQPCTKMLCDHSQLLGDWQGISARRGQQYFDDLAALGVLYYAWVYAPGYTDQRAMEKALYFTTNPAVAIFSDVASAYQWLLQLPKH
jgi:hypothetical protein